MSTKRRTGIKRKETKTKYAVIQHGSRKVNLFTRKLDATFFHIMFKRYTKGGRRWQKVEFKEIKSLNQLPPECSKYLVVVSKD